MCVRACVRTRKKEQFHMRARTHTHTHTHTHSLSLSLSLSHTHTNRYISIDPLIEADVAGTRSIWAGASITVRCRQTFSNGLGYSFNMSDVPESHYAVRET